MVNAYGSLVPKPSTCDSVAKKVYLTNVKGTFYGEEWQLSQYYCPQGNCRHCHQREIFLEGEVSAVSNDGRDICSAECTLVG